MGIVPGSNASSALEKPSANQASESSPRSGKPRSEERLSRHAKAVPAQYQWPRVSTDVSLVFSPIHRMLKFRQFQEGSSAINAMKAKEQLPIDILQHIWLAVITGV